MKPTGHITPDQLKREASDLKLLLKRYLHDRDFLAGEPEHHVVYFLDAHDLKSFVDPNRLKLPDDGFTLDAERARPHPTAEQFMLEAQLKNDQILGDLVLDERSMPAGLLPSHAEELEEELAFQNSLERHESLGLLRQAQEQVRRLQQDPRLRQIESIIDAGATTPEFRAAVMTFFQNNAPAVVALIQRKPDLTKLRIYRLLEHSAIRLPDSLDWARFGFGADNCAALRDFSADAGLVQQWRRYLTRHRAKRSHRSNRIDAEAIAWLQGLNDLLLTIPRPRVKALLVTRAWRLCDLAGNATATEEFGIRPADFLRHPRLTVLNSSIQALHADRAATDRPERVLAVALEDYHTEISLVSGEQATEENWASQAIDPLVRALHDFERARFALGLHTPGGPEATGAEPVSIGDVRELLKFFRNDRDVVAAIKHDLMTSVHRFSEAVVKLRRTHPGHLAVLAWTSPSDPPRRRLLPLAGSIIGPFDFPQPDDAERAVSVIHLYEQLSQPDDGTLGREAWTYLRWGMLLACDGAYSLAEVYAAGAGEIARMVGDKAGGSADEAHLLLRQIRRLRLRDDEGVERAQRRLERVVRDLDDDPEPDPRSFFERAALRLELHLGPRSQARDGGWVRFRDDIAAAASLCIADTMMQVCVLALGLAGAMAARPHSESRWLLGEGDEDLARTWHKRLHEAMRTLAQAESGRGKLPLLARAMELIGFQMMSAADSGRRTGSGDAQPPRPWFETVPIRIPAELRNEPFDIERLLHGATGAVEPEGADESYDRIGKLVFKTLGGIANGLRSRVQRELIYAPIWVPYASDAIVDLAAPGEAREATRAAYRLLGRVAGASQRFGVFERDRRDLLQAEEYLGAALNAQLTASRPGDAQARQASYFLEMEGCYCRLLLAVLDAANKQKQRPLLEALAQQYAGVATRFPESSIPHFRLNIIYSMLGKREKDEEIELEAAWERLDSDPYNLGKNRWLRSTMLRRRVALRMSVIQRERSIAVAGGEAAKAYASAVAEAIRDLSDNFLPDLASDDFLIALENERRLNNIVYYSSLLLEIDTIGSTLLLAGLSLEKLARLTRDLHPNGIDAVADRGIVHTIGFAYHLLGSTGNARQAGRRLQHLAVEDSLEDDYKLLRDAKLWLADGQAAGEMPVLAHAAKAGFYHDDSPPASTFWPEEVSPLS